LLHLGSGGDRVLEDRSFVSVDVTNLGGIARLDRPRQERTRRVQLQQEAKIVFRDDQVFFDIAWKKVDKSVQCQFADDGISALKRINNNFAFIPHVIFIDINMPIMNGVEMAHDLRMRDSLRDLPLVLMSGIDAAVDADANGFVRYLTKPIRQSQLFDAMMQALVRPRVVAAAVRPEATTSTASAPRAKSRKATRILLAEDMEVNQFVVTETLAREGYSCDIANNGREALAAVTRQQYDLVLMDCQMPEMSGFEATVAIRNLERERGETDSRLPIIALTANAVKGDRERCHTSGMDDYLTKPLNPAKLVEAIERHSRRSVPTPPQVSSDHAPPADSDVLLRETDGAFNYDELLERCAGDAAMLRKMAQMFDVKGRETFKQLVEQFGSANTAETTRLAHGIKGMAANLAAPRVLEIATRLEKLGRAGDLAAAEPVLAQLGAELERCGEAVQKICAGKHLV